jgi:hypothetical protein
MRIKKESIISNLINQQLSKMNAGEGNEWTVIQSTRGNPTKLQESEKTSQ